MPKFEKMDPSAVILGRGRAAALAREPYRRAIAAADAGRVVLDEDDDPVSVKRLLRQASKEIGVRVRSSWEDGSRSALLWKRTGA